MIQIKKLDTYSKENQEWLKNQCECSICIDHRKEKQIELDIYITEKRKHLKRIRASNYYTIWYKNVLHRDNFTCLKCGCKENIEAHHKKRVVDCPELSFIVDNGETLCHECHMTKHKNLTEEEFKDID